ncbi:MAG: hypothetical protein K2K97_04880, partial [Muribaculaceae bacterium]|nr:hypothetical protein [Muribaculaceae bacterium]
MKRKLLIGLALSALALPCLADGEIEAIFNSDKTILPSSKWTSRDLWQADVWIVNTGKNLAPNEGSANYNHIWGTPSDDSNGKHWYENDYTLTSGKPYSSDLFDSTGVIDWTTKSSPFNTDKWIKGDIAGDIYIRRQFTLTEIPEGPIYLACGRDDAPSEWYINGALVHSENHGWDENAVVLLTDAEKANLKVGENLMAVHVHQNWGGAYADCGLYGSDQRLYLLSKGGDGASWPCVYKLLDENSQIDGEVANGCFNVGVDESDWTTAMGPFSNSNDKWRTTYWDSDNHPILIRRHFTLNRNNLAALKARANIYLICSYDEYPVVYLNGKKIWSEERWNDNNYASYKLSDDDKKLLLQGDNVLAISAQRGEGGGHVEYALYIDYPCVGFTYVADLTLLQSTLENLISNAKELIETPQINNAIASAEANLKNAETEEELQDAINAINQAITAVKDATSDIETYYETINLFADAEAVKIFENAQTRDDYARALRILRYARRYEAADKHEDLFDGHVPAEGDFYLYNVGRKQFLCGGCEWGAHVALGFPGVLLTLEGSGNSFVIETGLY